MCQNIKSVENILLDKKAWKNKLLRDTSNNLINAIKQNYEEFEGNY